MFSFSLIPITVLALLSSSSASPTDGYGGYGGGYGGYGGSPSFQCNGRAVTDRAMCNQLFEQAKARNCYAMAPSDASGACITQMSR